MVRFIFLLVFAIGFSTASADAIVKDKNVKESTPKYRLSQEIDFQGSEVFLDERTDKNFIKDLKSENVFHFPHPFVAMVGTAFANHHSIEIYPDDIWLLIMDGISQHVNYNRDKLKDKFVPEGVDTNLVVNDNALTPQSPPSAWKKNISAIYDSLYQKLPEATRNAFDIDFSTSTDIDKLVAKTTLMAISSTYYTYSIRTLCGIPQIVIKGKKKDWQKLKDSFDKLAVILDMPWWAEQIDPILNEFILTFDKKFNMEFWRGIYKYIPPKNSGAVPNINGWITKFFPYIPKDEQKHRTHWDEQVKFRDLTTGRNDVWITWKYLGKEIPLLLSTGFWGVTIDSETKRLKTIRGYVLTGY